MSHTRRYYEVKTDDVDYPKMVAIATKPVISLNGENAIIKLHDDDHTDYPFFNQYTLLTYEECLILRRSKSYSSPPAQ